jgi:hypothetical protein
MGREISMRVGLAVVVIGAFCALAGPSGAADPEFSLAIKDHKFIPAEFEVPSGVKIKLLIKNEDPTPEEFESRELHREKVVPPGQTVPIFVGPLDPGTYGFFGDFNPQTAQGKLIAK